MLDKSIFHPRLSIYKKPFGAVPTGTAVHFSTGLPEHAVGWVLSLAFRVLRHSRSISHGSGQQWLSLHLYRT